MPAKISEELEHQIIELINQNRSQKEIERITTTSRRVIKRIGIENGAYNINASNKKEEGYMLWRQGKSLTEIQKILNINRGDLSDYIKSRGETISNSSIKFTYNEDVFENINSEEKAYWLGFISADGCICEHIRDGKVKSMNLEIALAIKDISHLKKFCKFIGISDNNIKLKSVYLKATNKTYEACRICIYNTKICNDLIKLGVAPRKTEMLKFCTAVPSGLLIHYLRGYVDADGYILVRRTKSLGLSFMATQSFIDMAINKFNIGHHRIEKKTSTTNVHNLAINCSDSKRLIKDMYFDANIYLDRKYDKVIAVLNSNI